MNSSNSESISAAFYNLAKNPCSLVNPLPLEMSSLSPLELGDSKWGDLKIPHPLIIADRQEYLRKATSLGALRVAIFGSFYRGLQLLNSLIEYEAHPKQIAVVTGFCTDDVSSNEAKITSTKRVWQYIPVEQRANFESQVVNLALNSGIPVYSGEVKSDIFQGDVFPNIFMPDVAIMGTFGQKINPQIFNLPRFGMYNFHPSDLANGKYPGPNPFQEMLLAEETSTRLTIHQVDTGFDSGQIVGYSPEICIEFEQATEWTFAEKIIALHQKTSRLAGIMSCELLWQIKEHQSPLASYNFEKFLVEDCLTEESLKYLSDPIKGRPKDHIPHAVISA